MFFRFAKCPLRSRGVRKVRLSKIYANSEAFTFERKMSTDEGFYYDKTMIDVYLCLMVLS